MNGPTYDEIIAACDAFHAHTAPSPEQALTQYHWKQVIRKMEKMVRKGMLDYGVSVRTAWVVR